MANEHESADTQESVGAVDTDAPEAETQESAPASEGGTAGNDLDTSAALARAEEKAAEHLEAAMRAKAELENLRKRSAREVENAHKFGLERLVGELLPVVDSLELGLAASTGEDPAVGQIREGLELTLKMFLQALEKFEVAQVDPVGAQFDPEFHQAISMQEIEGSEPGTVVTVVQKGYLLHGRLFRPAMVIVAQ